MLHNEGTSSAINAEKKRRGDFTDFSEYMDLKESKPQEQSAPVSLKSDIFRGVCAHVNGRTDPPLSELRQMILEHGGAFAQYFHRERVTHFICTQMAKYELENFSERSHGKIKVILPNWIADSINAGQLLDEFKYRICIQNDPKQPNLNHFFAANSAEFEHVEHIQHIEHVEQPENVDNGAMGRVSDESVEKDEAAIEDGIELLADLLDLDGIEAPEEAVEEAPYDPRTSANPEFLTEFYKNSRLHHLSTWREELKAFAIQLMQNKREQQQNHRPSQNSSVLHVDLDCFFVSVSLLELEAAEAEALKGKPIAVCHARPGNASTDSSSDISSCNYEARVFGVRNGMYLREALKLCPQLRLISYQFEAYSRCSRKFYEVLAESATDLLAVSCDEAYLTLPSGEDTIEAAASELRAKILKECRVEASVGLGPNMLIARLATRKAKPHGQFRVPLEDVDAFMSQQLLSDLPGVGDGQLSKLPEGLEHCRDLLSMPLGELQNRLGIRQGLSLFRKIRGLDDRSVAGESTLESRKSVGSEVSWGVRFSCVGQCKRFIDDLCEEVWQRLVEAFPPNSPNPLRVRPRRISLKLYRKQAGSGESLKHLGRGICDVFHRTRLISKGLDGLNPFKTETWQLFESEMLKSLKTQIEDVRGIGVFLSELIPPKRLTQSISEGFKKLLIKQDTANGINNASNNSSGDLFWINESQIDANVWPEIPEDIKQELHTEWNRRKQAKVQVVASSTSASKPSSINRKNPPSKKQQPVTLTQMWGIRERREAQELREALEALPADQFDREVLLALPRDLQLEIISQWKSEQKMRSVIPSELLQRDLEGARTAGVVTVDKFLPITFLNETNWTSESVHAYILPRASSKIHSEEVDALLVELVLHNCLKPVRDSFELLKGNPVREETIRKIKTLVKDLYNFNL